MSFTNNNFKNLEKKSLLVSLNPNNRYNTINSSMVTAIAMNRRLGSNNENRGLYSIFIETNKSMHYKFQNFYSNINFVFI